MVTSPKGVILVATSGNKRLPRCVPRLYSPECMEKLFGKAKRTPNRDSEGRQEGT